MRCRESIPIFEFRGIGKRTLHSRWLRVNRVERCNTNNAAHTPVHYFGHRVQFDAVVECVAPQSIRTGRGGGGSAGPTGWPFLAHVTVRGSTSATPHYYMHRKCDF